MAQEERRGPMEPRPPAQQTGILAYSSPKNVLVILAGREPSLLIGIEETTAKVGFKRRFAFSRRTVASGRR
jgi:hypothetical protein